MSTPEPTGARPDSGVQGWPATPPAAGPQAAQPEYIFWYHTGGESVCFFPPGSVQEHLVIEHGIDSLEVRRHAKGHHDHDHDHEHSKQPSVPLDTIGDLLAVGHAHEAVA